MKNILSLALVISVSGVLVASEGRQKKNPAKRALARSTSTSSLELHSSNELRKSKEELRKSRELCAKAALLSAKDKNRSNGTLSPASVHSSGSSPAGAHHLFPGQKGNGLFEEVVPVHRSPDFGDHWH